MRTIILSPKTNRPVAGRLPALDALSVIKRWGGFSRESYACPTATGGVSIRGRLRTLAKRQRQPSERGWAIHSKRLSGSWAAASKSTVARCSLIGRAR